MSEETETKPRRGRPPKDPQSDQFPDVGKMVPAPPDADPKSLEMMDWIFTYLPNEMARNFYGGLNHTPRP